MKKNLQSVLGYFTYFSYTPSFDEIYTFFPVKITKKALRSFLHSLPPTNYPLPSTPRVLLPIPYTLPPTPYAPHPTPSHTLPQYSTNEGGNKKNKSKLKFKESIRTIQTYIYLLKRMPIVRFVGITGKSAMEGIREGDDVDLCVVTKQGLLWTTRFCIILLAKILGIHGKTGVCLNLFFDESDLIIPLKKQNLYIAHELLQMKTVIDKSNIYMQFLQENKWLYSFFPNAPVIPANAKTLHVIPTHSSSSVQAPVGIQSNNFNLLIDHIFERIQIPIIRRNKTAFYISHTQLWLFRRDFERTLKKKMQL